VLVDAPSYEFPGDDSMLLPEFKGRNIGALLTASGVPLESITDVVITHPHLDHTLGLALPIENPSVLVFPNARHYLGAKDWQNLGNMEEVERQPLQAVQRSGLLTLVDGFLDLGDGLTLLPAPGETPGHQILWLKDEAGGSYFVGDLFHHPLEFDEPGRNPLWAEPQSLQASKSMLIERAAKSGAQVFFTHIEGALRVEESNGEMVWKKILT
jgi:glyoxylase-like metal-dependent hydrolase (beta-lactamase superfamily II)